MKFDPVRPYITATWVAKDTLRILLKAAPALAPSCRIHMVTQDADGRMGWVSVRDGAGPKAPARWVGRLSFPFTPDISEQSPEILRPLLRIQAAQMLRSFRRRRGWRVMRRRSLVLKREEKARAALWQRAATELVH